MPALFSPIVAFFATSFGKMLVDRLLLFLAIKTLLTALFVIVFPIVLNNFFHSMIEIVINIAQTQSANGGTLDGGMDFSGFAAYLMDCFRVSECISILISAIQLRLALSMIPFVNFGR